MKLTQVALPFLFAGAAIAAPVSPNTLETKSTQMCSGYQSVVMGVYTVYQNLWGRQQATSGSQCLTVKSMTGSTIAWSDEWSWQGQSNQVKAYSNVALTSVSKTGVKISSISSIPAVWNWQYSGTNVVADVSWDIFTAPTAGGANKYEIMLWLGALGGAAPISSTGSPVATVTLSGYKFKLYSGTNGGTTVFSFVAISQINNFKGDLLPFLNYLATMKNNLGFSVNQYVNVLQAGTEPFTGTKAVFSVSAYSVSVSQKSSGSVKVKGSPAKGNTNQSNESTNQSKENTDQSKVAASSVPLYGNCTGGKTCSVGKCVKQNDSYSQCVSA
ncbi:hypothetical protein DSL72_007445 [Monilinia vaccinii-corymbosi]|uniref:CBM1 domain-containing protein n=1 Tax=Monilinia vaccinii-corymbosi TaxID=61207 RepID=A0A8A3PN13_9HELO|nr:hypothetical protein DSL72_007445 [Monilinia vaccinii-corymbosi]